MGATGIAGQQFVVALQRHPWFRIARLAPPSDPRTSASARRCASRERALAAGGATRLVSHNTKMGAAAGAVLVAEHLVTTGDIR